MSGPSVAMFHESTGGTVTNSKLINSGQNTTYNETQNYNFNITPTEGENAKTGIGLIQALAEQLARTSNQSTSGGPIPQTVDTDQSPGPSRHPVEISSITAQDLSQLPPSNIADRYTRSMLECTVGYPLCEPKPFSQHATGYVDNGINVGDVGIIRDDGAFDFLFNICPPQNKSINPPDLPNDGFSLETSEDSETREMEPLSAESFFPPTVTQTGSGKYTCKGPEGAILVLPEGAIQHEAINKGRFEELAKRHGVEWYKYTKSRGRGISNGSLYLVTSFMKCTRWGIAVFDRPCDPGQGLSFGKKLLASWWNSTPTYGWTGSGALIRKVANPNPKDALNQCVFLRGYKIMIRQDIFDQLPQPATRMRGGRRGRSLLSCLISTLLPCIGIKATQSTEDLKLANIKLHPIHPSNLINAALLSQNPDAKISLTHDDFWCDLVQDNILKLATPKANITSSYKSTVDEYGSVTLTKNDAILYEVHGDTVTFQFGDGPYTEQERSMIRDYLSNVIVFTLVDDIMKPMKSHSLTPSLPNTQAAYRDDQIKNKYESHVKGPTRSMSLLQETADWISGTNKTRIYVLSGPAGIGKSTIAYTIAARTDALGLLAASFFFSRDDTDRNNGKMFFTTIAYQLCLYDKLFAKAIEVALRTKKPLWDATTKNPQEQLEALILQPLKNIVRSRIRPILVVVDGLDECEEDRLSVLSGLTQLVRDLPSFKVILTTRPQLRVDNFFQIQHDYKIFHVRHIKSTRLGLTTSHSRELVGGGGHQ